MKIPSLALYCLLFSPTLFAASSLYCPQHYGTIQIGMTQAEVIKACGQPLSKQESNKPVINKIPMTQFIYNNQGAPRTTVAPGTSSDIYYGLWSNATAVSGTPLQIDIIDNKIYAIQINDSEENGASICGGRAIQIGDPVASVYAACGAPLLVNSTYINQIVESPQRPEVWVYQPSQYQATINLTFVGGKLQSIN